MLEYLVYFIPVDKLLALPAADQDKHIGLVVECLGTPEKGPPSQRRIHLLNYVGSLGTNSMLANLMVKHGILAVLARQLKDVPQFDV